MLHLSCAMCDFFKRIYDKSLNQSSICKPLFQPENTDYISHGINLDPVNINSVQKLSLFIVLVFILFTTIKVIDVRGSPEDPEANFHNDTIALAIGVVIFLLAVGTTSMNRFDRHNFCVMNYNDPICHNIRFNCMDQRHNSLQMVDFNLGQFMKANKSTGTGFQPTIV